MDYLWVDRLKGPPIEETKRADQCEALDTEVRSLTCEWDLSSVG